MHDKIRLYLSNHVPKYMIPSEIFTQNKIRLNKNGKVDRNYYINKFDK